MYTLLRWICKDILFLLNNFFPFILFARIAGREVSGIEKNEKEFFKYLNIHFIPYNYIYFPLTLFGGMACNGVEECCDRGVNKFEFCWMMEIS